LTSGIEPSVPAEVIGQRATGDAPEAAPSSLQATVIGIDVVQMEHALGLLLGMGRHGPIGYPWVALIFR
jgi:hypothetical protein